MGVMTFEEIPTRIVEVPKIVLPMWAKIVLGVLAAISFIAILSAIFSSQDKKKLEAKLQESTTKEGTLKSKNQKLATDNKKLTEGLNRYTGGRGLV